MPELESTLAGPDATLDELEAAGRNLTAELGAEEWDNANVTLRQLRSALETLGRHIDAADEDDARHDVLTGIYNAATDQHNQAVETLYGLERYEGWRIGDNRPCGCPVEPVSVACPRCEAAHDQAMTDCTDCQFGVPGVRHWNRGCEDPK